ncbi:hypothetical protein [Candidatus Magnetominusculus xianensis]|uniref:Uncharacterized protein n=1 Tax=Candidatus Magnetominusculus xianensis TaxID=1748249 RepID=A0ABR5SCS6_9BACT|nr:hypothetical protein [Candidatus Magnetominusculus xianensis]KWT76394.1 hypothetical protein ASN18_3133 [Candidatus Magnetominusculus xianensis]MBF0404862.1 hypothetical protein [Nitrospirota bacterium]
MEIADHKKHDKKSGANAMTTAKQFILISSAPIHECLVSENLFDAGIGHVIISRTVEDNRVGFSIFLLDVFCLGVTNAFYIITSKADYDRNIVMRTQRQQYVDIRPACAVKLVEDVVLFAEDLGFQPHKDYHVAKEIFGDVNPFGDVNTKDCKTEYRFGKEGKPYFVARPSDSPRRCKKIIDKLTAKCGAGGFIFEAPCNLSTTVQKLQVHAAALINYRQDNSLYVSKRYLNMRYINV